MSARRELTRRALYDLVWSKPMRDAAADVGISDVGLKKRCRSQAVPVPPQGYWNKVHAGHRMPPRPPLPPQARPPTVEPSQGEEQKLKSTKLHAPATGASFTGIRAQLEGKAQRTSETSPLPKGNVRRKRKRRTAPRYAYEHYSLSIERWEWDYSFGINEWKKHFRGTYREHRALTIHGVLHRPAGLIGTRAEVSFLPSDMEGRAQRLPEPPTSIGQMWRVRREQKFEVFVSLPSDVLPSLLSMLIAEKLRFVTLDGMVLFRGRTEIRRFSFDATAYWKEELAA
ncbi:hypothetical protein [Reyranella sp.]|uniref:hypothetical protein n=1 Tax=Reyranella sp. TaxID=1929291 RepID=UPI00120B0842|nr:hypothetical protein [Reyranella sp.]TAJ82896.1 MAG: hypothetical protein EPO50_24665 [Reyranella sp.]